MTTLTADNSSRLGVDDLREMVRAFNQTTDRLQQTHDELKARRAE